MKKILMALVMITLIGCSSSNEINEDLKNNDTTTQTTTEGFEFVVNGVEIQLEDYAEDVLDQLGEYTDKFEAKSCAFNGWDYIYYYGGFELHTGLPEGEEETISAIEFIDDSVTTKEGIYLGSTLDNIISVYGEDYVESDNLYTYVKGNTKLSFIIEDSKAISVSYSIVE